MNILMPVTKPTAVGILLEGIRQAKELHAPRSIVHKLEEELITQALVILLSNQNKISN